jgi:hypothetical protein
MRTSVRNTLVEVSHAGDLGERTHLDAGGAHVDDEVGDALVLGHIGVGASQQDAVVGVLAERGPDLLAVDDPLVAVALGAGAQRREVAAGTGFAEQLAPQMVAAQHRAEETLLLLR